ncbi:MAG: thioredoxin family protein [Gordonibacter sp.]|uniref:thioredoxin family protein n=1 Tax=Gordonibacter sp. TaxID=1968902 RepID=UPI002FC865E4
MRRVLFFWADYCGMCRAVRELVIDPLIERGFEVEAIDCMAKPSRAERYGVTRLPTTIVLDHDGEVYAAYRGVCPPESIGEMIEEEPACTTA